MEVKTFKGYDKKVGVQVAGELTLEDFTISKNGISKTEYSFTSWSVELTLKDEVAKRLDAILPRHRSYSYKESKDIVTVQNSWTTSRHFRYDYRGCKNDASKVAKDKREFDKAVVWEFKNSEKRINDLVEKINKDLVDTAENMTREYTRAILDVMNGERMSTEFIEEKLDSPGIKENLENLDKEIEALKKERSEAWENRRQLRNENMLKYLKENGWNDEDETDEGETKVVIMESLREKLEGMYKEGKGFSTSRFNHMDLDMFLD